MNDLFTVSVLLACFMCMSALHAESITAENLAIIVNISDRQSVELAKYYQEKRHVADKNIIRVAFDSDVNEISKTDFIPVLEEIKRKTGSHIRAYAVSWTRPYIVGCMSMTSAIALGYDEKYCATGCRPTQKSEYYDLKPGASVDHVKPTMMLAGPDTDTVKALVDRGVSADFSRPNGNAYLVSTSDKARNVRSVDFEKIRQLYNELLNVQIIDADFIRNRKDVFLYFTGISKVRYLKTLEFIPGAVADHLTSTGGDLLGTRQMSSLAWLQAGATASYGNVVEPCNFIGKFPHPGVFMYHYLNGDALVDAYWKSVSMPGQGIFIGEPLARPFNGCRLVLARAGIFQLINASQENFVLRSAANCNIDSGSHIDD